MKGAKGNCEWNKIHEGVISVAQVTETRTGPLGCSNYDNLDSVSSVLVQSPENKVQLQGECYLLSIIQYTHGRHCCMLHNIPI